MRSERIKVDKKDCLARADGIFRRIAGIDKEGKGFQRMQEQADHVLELCKDCLDPHIVYTYYDSFGLKGRKLVIHGEEFRCPAFELVDPDCVEGVYAYLISAGDFSMDSRQMVDGVLADLLGTAFVDALKDIMTDQFKQDGMLSDSFGPGFYGMRLEEIHKMPHVVDFDAAGVHVLESGVMVPIKSRTGILFRVNEDYRRMVPACLRCDGSDLSCRLCGAIF